MAEAPLNLGDEGESLVLLDEGLGAMGVITDEEGGEPTPLGVKDLERARLEGEVRESPEGRGNEASELDNWPPCSSVGPTSSSYGLGITTLLEAAGFRPIMCSGTTCSIPA